MRGSKVPEQTVAERAAAEVRAEIARQQRRRGDLAVVLGMSRTPLHLRLTGKIPFDINEITIIAAWLDVPLVRFLPALASEAKSA